MDPKLTAALKLLQAATPSTLNPSRLAGPAYAKARAAILTALTGEKVPTAKAGVNALREALFAATGAKGCLAVQEAEFVAFAKKALDQGDGLDAKGLRDTQRTY